MVKKNKNLHGYKTYILKNATSAWVYLLYKLDHITIPMTLKAQRYQQEVPDVAVIPHFDNHPLATRRIFMDDNARPHRGRTVIAHLQSNAIETLPWPARSHDINLIQHIWAYLGRQVQARDLPVRNLQEK